MLGRRPRPSAVAVGSRLIISGRTWPRSRRRSMTRSPAKPRPVRVGRYRYSKLRWRLLVHALDFCGTICDGDRPAVRPARPVDRPRRILVVQLDHLGDAVLSTPLIAELRAAYPEAAIDVLASPSNHEVFEADPHVNRVWVAERTWFERRPDRWGLVTAVWNLGRSLRAVRLRPGHRRARRRAHRAGAGAGGSSAPRRLVDGRRGVPADRRRRLDSRAGTRSARGWPCSTGWESRPTSRPGSTSTSRDEDRIAIARRLAEAWPRRSARGGPRSYADARRHADVSARHAARRRPRTPIADRSPTSPTGCTPIDSRRCRPSWPCTSGPATRPSAGRPARGRVLIERFLDDGWRVVVVGGIEDVPLSSVLEPHDRLRDWTGSLTVTQTTALPRAGRPLHRRRLRPGAPGGLGGHALGHPLQRDQPAPAVAALVAALADPPPPRPLPALPPEGLPARRPPLHVRA